MLPASSKTCSWLLLGPSTRPLKRKRFVASVTLLLETFEAFASRKGWSREKSPVGLGRPSPCGLR